MLDIRVLRKIRNDAIDSIKKDSDGVKVQKLTYKITFYFLWYIAPIASIVISLCKKILLSDLQNYIGTVIALFTGLFFSLLLRLGDKLRAEKANINIDENNYKQFKENLKQISSITQFIILLGIKIFILLVINSLIKSTSYPYIEIIITSLSIFILLRYIITIGFLLQRFHFTLRDELNNTIG